MKKSVRSGLAGILCVFLLGGMLLCPCAAAQEGDPAVQRTDMSAQGDEAAVIWYQDGVRTDHPSEGKVYADVGLKNHTDAAAVITSALAVYDTKNCLRLLQRQFHTVNRNSRGSWAKIPRKYVTVTAGLPTCCLYFTALKCKAKLEHTQVFFCMSFSLKGK